MGRSTAKPTLPPDRQLLSLMLAVMLCGSSCTVALFKAWVHKAPVVQYPLVICLGDTIDQCAKISSTCTAPRAETPAQQACHPECTQAAKQASRIRVTQACSARACRLQRRLLHRCLGHHVHL